MADVPQRLKPPSTSNSLTEMAAKAAQRTHSNRPPPPPPIIPAQLKPPSVYPGSGPGASRSRAPGHASSQNGDSGLIHLQALQGAPSIGPGIHPADVRHMTAPPTAHRARLETNPFESRGSRGMLVGFIVGLLVIAGAYGLAVKRGMQPMAAGRNLLAMLRNWDAPPATPQFSITDTKSSTTETPATAATTTEPQVPRGLDPNNLPAVGATPVTVPEPSDVLAQAKSVGRVRSAARPAVEAAPAPKPEKSEPKAEPPAPAPKPVAKAEPKEPEPTGLAGAIKRAVGPQETPKPVAAEVPETPAMRGDIPETPPQGAIQGAIGSHRQAARACLEGHDSPSRATILFASTGKVQSVNVAGPAAGTGAEGCIARTLSKAAVGPFRRPSFSVTTTISPP